MQEPLAPSTTAASVWQQLRLQRPALALELAERLLAQDPTSPAAHLVRTEALRQLRRLPEAALAAQAAITVAPQSAAVFRAFAQIKGQQGELIKAEYLLNDALRLEPTNAGHYGFLAQLQFLQRRHCEAIASATAGLHADAQHADCLLWRSLAQEARAQPAAADADFERALRLAPTSALLHQRWGEMLMQRADPVGATQHLAEALRLNPQAAATLLPVLRRAVRWQQGPAWMARRHQQLCREWQHERVLSYAGGGTLLLMPYFLMRTWWLTRHDPLFQLSHAQVWRRWLILWLAIPILLTVGVFIGGYFGVLDIDTPLSLVQMSGMVLGGGLFWMGILLLKKQIDS